LVRVERYTKIRDNFLMSNIEFKNNYVEVKEEELRKNILENGFTKSKEPKCWKYLCEIIKRMSN
jgi:hypothetical protein